MNFKTTSYNDLETTIEKLNNMFENNKELQKYGIPIVFLEQEENTNFFHSHCFFAFQVYKKNGKMPIFNTEHDQYGFLPETFQNQKGQFFIFEKMNDKDFEEKH